MAHYPFSKIEAKWQEYWQQHQIFAVKEDPSIPVEKRAYVLDMFPYPSGNGLHVGHPEGYTATDIYVRFLRANGFNVLHPMGFDSFGLPAENYAIKTGTHPQITTEENIETFRKQIKRLGFSYDWSREVQTHTPDYYRWTQWIFLQLYHKGLAYEDYAPINWCPSCKIGLANEEVSSDGKCDRCDTPVIRKQLRQWKLKITKYAEELLTDLDDLDWPDAVKAMQRNWIGKSQGASINFALKDDANTIISIYTTRPETLYGVTYIVVAPEHPLIESITTDTQRMAVEQYQAASALKNDLERSELSKTKSGVFSGSYVIHPLTQQSIPIWVGDYVLMSYGTGAVMAVPAHDQRDFEFASIYNLPIKIVISPEGGLALPLERAFTEDGVTIESDAWNGMNVALAKEQAIIAIEKAGCGHRKTNYKLRDWIFSRQRYWGEPIPVVHCEHCGIVPLSESDLPLELPKVTSYQTSDTGESPLATMTDWLHTTCPKCQSPAKRETNTMPQWAGSCWYYLRYIDPHNTEVFIDKEKESYWMPVDLYIGGMEHAVLHLLYARFWHKVLYDLGLVSTKEPFQRLINQGMILGENNEKMSKSRGNVVNPDDMIDQFGADTLRLYEMFMGPLQATKPWSTHGMVGVHRFLSKVYDYAHLPRSEEEPPKSLQVTLHKTIKKVTEDTRNLEFNTAISQMMIFINEALPIKICYQQLFNPFIILLAPYAPHLAEELYALHGATNSITFAPWPTWQEEMTIDSEVTLGVQINGKLRAEITVAKDISADDLGQQALAIPRIQELCEGNSIKKIIAIPGKIVNIIIA
ncbi:leucine--tRNA ligase [Entomospira nematocerorum]|uniref:Leucine--tRNA ligase n=1 Tax=Entomospira nematocerorum TaxID=2719987 RepID=A0A968GI00_9SPIO|nr:leucine--tRNA ligase [Entomospira nematocera]NIZ47481.1 leucine--tRNA ligase [Entomospira nematocera]WDI33979.1 leucine--tRNA ligase [Entomospira nematocera]